MEVKIIQYDAGHVLVVEDHEDAPAPFRLECIDDDREDQQEWHSLSQCAGAGGRFKFKEPLHQRTQVSILLCH